jgi:peptidoglycan/LPS O-acetylase OafA/YrhL
MTAPNHYRYEIDGLRAIAVGSVIVNHFDSTIMPGGYLGVDIFFVISGYVISLSLCSREFASFKDLLLGFYARRFKRLMPALVLVVAVTSLLISLVNADPRQSLHTGIFALFGLSNLYLWRVANDYFGEPSQLNAFTHTWSLGVEEQFYLIFPLILWLLLHKNTRTGFRNFSFVLSALGVLWLALFVYVGRHQPMAAFYLMPLRFWELAAGCLIALYHDRRGRPERAGWRWAETAITAGIVVVLVLPLPLRLAPVANIAVVALTGAGLAVLAPGSLAYRLLTCPPARYLGVLSYSLYLWHWPILVLSRFTVGEHWFTVPVLAGLILLTAHLSYHLVEQPLRAASWGRTHRSTIWRGGVLTGVGAVLVLILAKPLEGRLYAGKPAELAARNVESLADPYRIPRTPYGWAGAPCILGSDGDVGKDIPLDACTLGRFSQAPHRIMVFGNSFSAAFVHAFDELVSEDHYAVTITSAWGASPVKGLPNDSPWSHTNAYYWGTVVPRMASRLRAGDWVLLMSDTALLAPPQATPADARNLALYRQALLDYSAQLGRAGVRLAVLDVNSFVRDTYCQPDNAVPQWFAPGGGSCRFLTRAETIARRRRVDAMLRQLQQDHRLVVIDMLDLFCPLRFCTYVGRGNHVLYRDEFSHPSVEAARDAAPLLHRLLTGDGAAD